MFEQIFYILLAILGLGFLVFIHELGHYWMARRQGMTIEIFSIGFGKPIYAWMKDGVRWQVSWIPFGGYVKIAGMQKEGAREPYEIEGGFYSKSPLARIKVAFMGPLVNILFALLAFTGVWMCGGRDKSFSEFTHHIGWVDPNSNLYDKGVRPGDVIESYGGRPFGGVNDLRMASVMKGETTQIAGYKIDYLTGNKADFDYSLKNYNDPNIRQAKISTIGVMSPAQYLIFKNEAQMIPGSPMANSGIEEGDRLVWADGEMLFSTEQLISSINESTAFLTVKRGDLVFQTKVPRIHLDELKMTAVQKAEMDDWQHEAGMKGRLQDLFFIPYLLSPSGLVEMRLNFLEEETQEKAFTACQRCAYFHPLEEGDVILAVDGQPISSSYDLLHHLQERKVLLIVQRDPEAVAKVSWAQADESFDEGFEAKDLAALISHLGMERAPTASGHLVLLQPVVPKTLSDLALSSEYKHHYVQELEKFKKKAEAIQDPQQREEQLQLFEKNQNKLFLGMQFKDREVVYNPSPLKQFFSVFEDTWRTLSALFSGSLNPKYMSGPVGIVQIVHYSWLVGAKEALFWMGVISLNLGFVNLLPVPVLDGGHIGFALFEACTKRRLSGKTMERLVIPFVGLLIALFVYITFQDVSRLFSRFF